MTVLSEVYQLINQTQYQLQKHLNMTDRTFVMVNACTLFFIFFIHIRALQKLQEVYSAALLEVNN